MDSPDTRTRTLDRDNLATEPFSVQLIDTTEMFVLARLAPHASTEPSTDTERMASHLTHGVRLHAMHARLNARAVGLHEAWLSWRHLADLARMFSDHPDYREDFGRTIWEFPTRSRRGYRSGSPAATAMYPGPRAPASHSPAPPSTANPSTSCAPPAGCGPPATSPSTATAPTPNTGTCWRSARPVSAPHPLPPPCALPAHPSAAIPRK